MKFARLTFWLAAVYGAAVTVPLYFAEQTIALQYPPAMNHPEYYYSFAGVTLAWQILFIVIALKPDRFRAIMIPCVLEKLSLFPTLFILYPQGRFPTYWIPLVIIDALFAILFLVAFFKSKSKERAAAAGTGELLPPAEEAEASPRPL